MMTRQVARQFCRLGEIHSLIYGRRASGENHASKLTASARRRLGEPSNGLSGLTIFGKHSATVGYRRLTRNSCFIRLFVSRRDSLINESMSGDINPSQPGRVDPLGPRQPELVRHHDRNIRPFSNASHRRHDKCARLGVA